MNVIARGAVRAETKRVIDTDPIVRLVPKVTILTQLAEASQVVRAQILLIRHAILVLVIRIRVSIDATIAFFTMTVLLDIPADRNQTLNVLVNEIAVVTIFALTSEPIDTD